MPILAFLAYYGGKHILTGTASAPADLQVAAPSWLIWVWTLSLALGSVLATYGLVTERTRAESVGLAWSLFGIVFYMADNTAGAATVLLAVMCLIRLNALRRARQRQARMTRLIEEAQR